MAGTLTVGTLSDGTNSGSATDAIKGSAKAWVNFNGTGTVAIRASHNVSSITDGGTGIYTVNFTSALSDANYASVCTVGFSNSGANFTMPITPSNSSPTASALPFRSYGANGSTYDASHFSVAIFR
jgi:hypothetical protein